MSNFFKEKIFDEKELKVVNLKKINLLMDIEEVEIKKLELEDLEEVHKLMQKMFLETTKQQIKEIIEKGMSYGAYVERILVSVGLAWPVHFNEKKEKIIKGEPNAVYLDNVILLLAYEGRGIRKMLINEREKIARAHGLEYAVVFINSEWPKGNLADMIAEQGDAVEKTYLECNYRFIRVKNGILGIKKL